VDPDDQITPVDESPDELAEDLALEWFVEVGEGQVAAADQVEGARGNLLRDVLLAEFDTVPQVIPDPELIPSADEGTIPQVLRQILHAAGCEAPRAGAAEHRLVGIRGDDP
jgi:hypothetical protein